MIRKSDWQTVHEDMLAEERHRLGDPPTAEEMLAYRRGELSPEDEARVRELLVAYPELARAVAVPFDDTEARPGEDGYLSGTEVDRQWDSMQRRIHGGRLMRFPAAWIGLAAAIALVFGALYWQEIGKVRRLERTLAQPHLVTEVQELYPGVSRGPSSFATLTAGGDRYVIRLVLVNAPQSAGYRIEIRDTATAPRVLWKTTTVDRDPAGNFVVVIPRSFLAPGKYLIHVYGVDGREELLGDYRIVIPSR